MRTAFDVLGIGNAIVDRLVEVNDDVVAELGVEKGSMNLIDEAAAAKLAKKFSHATTCSGGSAANTMVGLAALGAEAAYIGRVSDDALGSRFKEELADIGVEVAVQSATTGPATASSSIFVTPDAQRTMQTYLGACAELSAADVDESLVEKSEIIYLEGYLFDPPPAQEAFLKAARAAHKSGRKVALTLSDAFCVDRHRESFLDFVEHHVDILFANETEICSLYREPDVEAAAKVVRKHCEMAALTLGKQGALLLSEREVIRVGVDPDVVAVDTTGAGDLYAGGLLFGIVRGYSLADAGRIGAITAGEVISHVGARPKQMLAKRVLNRLNSVTASPVAI